MTRVIGQLEGLRIVGQAGLGFPPPPTSYARAAYGGAQPSTQAATWLIVGPDGNVTAFAGKVEYGQGIRAGFAIEVADELCVPLDAVEVVLGDTDRTPWDMGTFGSQSTARVGLQLRKAAATAREALAELAANELDLPAGDLVCSDGSVSSRFDPGRTLTFGQLLRGKSLTREVVEEAQLKPAAESSLMGRDIPRIDGVAIVTGAATYSQDVTVPGMVFAKIVRPPSYGARLVDVDSSVADGLAGTVQVLRDGDLVAVLAESDEDAELGASAVLATWDERPDEHTHWDMPSLLLETRREPFTTQEAGSLEDGFRQAAGILEETYYLPYVSNVPMEPRAAVAQWKDGRLTVWAGTQRPFGLRHELAEHFKMDEADVHVIAPAIGGGFGSKSLYPAALEAARLAMLAERPTRIAYTRNEEMVWSTFRPAALIQIKSGFKSDGTIVSWQCNAYHAGERPFIGRRGSETPYDTPNVNVTVFTSDSPLRTGSYRSLGGAVNHFARESHIDEIAVTTGIDPVELRLRNLSHPRFRRVLETAAARFGWKSTASLARRGVGIAIGLDVGSYVATAVQLDVHGGEVKVERVVAALDCGFTVNPEGARNQVEGSIVMGMGTALYEAIDFQRGGLLNPSFSRYRVPRINNAPAIEVELVGDAETPSTGAGEPGIVPIAPAIANAVYNLTGRRHRELPLGRHLR